jgi:nucleoside-diphosphate-sugar epimerase
VAKGEAHRTGIAGQVFSRVHVADLARGVIAGFDAPAGVYNLADDLPAPQDEVVVYAAQLLGLAPPPIVPVEQLSPAARGFHAENRRVANGKAKRVLNWHPRYPDYRAGLRALSATTSPTAASPAPATASGVQR